MTEAIDLTTITGVAAFTLAVTEAVKRIFLKNATERPWYGTVVNIMTVGFAVGGAVAYRLLADPTVPWDATIYNGVGGAVMAVGGYEGVTNLLRALFKR